MGSRIAAKRSAAVLLASLATLALLATACGVPPAPGHVTIDGHRIDLVGVADSERERSRGLQDRERLGPDEGMLFVWDDAAPRLFAIMDVDYALDVIFIAEDGRVTEVLALAPDGPFEAPGTLPARWVVEVESGWADRHGVEPASVTDLAPSDSGEQ
jgi:hypothetical protein